ncbi:MAG: alpha/beta fold hydrolase [Acidobacteriota bacterium]
MVKTTPGVTGTSLSTTTKDGVQLALHRWGDPDAPVVLLLTGAFSNHTFWLGTRGVGFARFLAEQGFCAYVLDFRGHGQSQRKPPGARWCFEDWAVHDIPAALEVASRGDPLRIVTHSAAGAAALTALALMPRLAEKVAKLAILATPYPALRGYRRLTARFAVFLCHLLGRFPARFLRLGPEDEDGGIMAQWLEWNLTGAWVTRGGVSVLSHLPSLSFPVLLVAGAGDWLWSPPPLCQRLWQMIPAESKEFWVVGKDDGCPIKPGHVSLVTHPECRRRFWPRLAAWLR